MSQSGWDFKRPEPAKKVHVVKIDNMKRIKFVCTALPVPAWHELTQVVEDFFVIMGRNGNKNVMDFILQICVFSFEFLNSVFFKKNLLCPNGGAKFHLPDEYSKKCFRTFFLTHAVRLFHHNMACFYLYSSQNTSVVVYGWVQEQKAVWMFRIYYLLSVLISKLWCRTLSTSFSKFSPR